MNYGSMKDCPLFQRLRLLFLLIGISATWVGTPLTIGRSFRLLLISNKNLLWRQKLRLYRHYSKRKVNYDQRKQC